MTSFSILLCVLHLYYIENSADKERENLEEHLDKDKSNLIYNKLINQLLISQLALCLSQKTLSFSQQLFPT